MRQIPIDMSHRLLEHNPIHRNLKKAIIEQNEIGWGHALRGRISKEWNLIQEKIDKAQKRKLRPGLIVNLICLLWEESIMLWKFRNGVQHGITKEEKRIKANKIIFPLVRAAYRTRHRDISLYNLSLFRLSLEERLKLEPRENERWLEIVTTAQKHKRIREEAVILATRKITSYFTNLELQEK